MRASFAQVLPLALVASLLAGSLAEAKPFRHRFNEWREYNKHWLSVCPIAPQRSASDYSTSCWATTFAGETYEFARRHQLAVYRHRDTGAVSLRFAVHWEDLAPDSQIVLRFDGAPPITLNVADLVTKNTLNEWWLTDSVAVAEAVKDMKAHNGLKISYRFADGREETVRFSLIGFTKAFKFLKDHAQIDR